MKFIFSISFMTIVTISGISQVTNTQIKHEIIKTEVEHVLELIDQISDLEEQLEISRNESDVNRETNQNLQSLYHRLQERYRTLQKQNQKLKIQLIETESEIEELNGNKEEFSIQVDSLKCQIEVLNESIVEIKEKAAEQTKQGKAKVNQLFLEMESRRLVTLKKSNKVYINHLNPIHFDFEINRPKNISFDLHYYPLFNESLKRFIYAEVSIRNSQNDPYKIYTLVFRRRKILKIDKKY